MLTRSKQRAIAAEFQSAEDQSGREVSALEMKLPSDWTELPAELLMMIFDNLKFEGNSTEERKSLLNCRLVHRQWKSAIDDLLEKKSLSFWKTGICRTDNPYMFPVVYFDPLGKQTLENIFFPSFLLGNKGNCPFSTRFVRLTSTTTFRNAWILSPKGDAHFFSKYGHHLTSLEIDPLLQRDFTALTMQQLLICTPHLKAMTLQCITIKLLEKDVGKISLPPLPHLEHVRLNFIRCRGSDFDVENWILEPYKEQLITLRCTGDLRCINSPEFPLLEQLRLFRPTPQLLLFPVMFPTLQIVDLMGMVLSEKIRPGRINWYHVFKFVSGVASALVELHLDIDKEPRSTSNPINYKQDHILQELQEIQKSRFPALKTLFISYPNSEEDMKAVKDFLKMFPNLKTLNLTRFELRTTGYGRPTGPYRPTMRRHLNLEKFQKFCPKLREINVYVGFGECNPFFTSRFPFFT